MKIKVHKLEGYNYIYVLNGFNEVPHTLYKYMPLKRFVGCLLNKELVFVSPKKWYDPFEKLYFNGDYSNHNYTPHEIACICVTSNKFINEEAAWRIYSDESCKSVRLSIDLDTLLKILNDYAERKSCKIYIGEVDYSLTNNDIKTVGKKTNSYYNDYCPKKMTIENYLTLMLLKRKSFEYEKEIRIFIVKKDSLFEENSDGILRINIEYSNTKLIKHVMLSPYPYEEKDKKEGKFFYLHNEAESFKLKKDIESLLGASAIVEQSRLYEGVKSYKIE